jgi:hypothetical protein
MTQNAICIGYKRGYAQLLSPELDKRKKAKEAKDATIRFNQTVYNKLHGDLKSRQLIIKASRMESQ